MAGTLSSQLVEALASRGDDLLFDSDDGTLTCDQILGHAEDVRAFFSGRGSGVVLFAADHGIGSRALYLGLLLCGITAAPVHASTPRHRLEAIASALGATEIVTAPTGGLAPPRAHSIVPTGTGPGAPPRTADGEAPAYVLHTSGSTGRPKGVPIPGAALQAYLEFITRALDWAPGARFSATFDLSFDLALHDLLVPVLTGGTSCPSHPKLAVLPHLYAQKHGITEWFSVPGAAAFARQARSLEPGSLKALDRSLFAGEALQSADAAYWAAATGTSVFNLYGPTELTLAATWHEYREGESYPTVPIGRAFDHLRARTGSGRDPDELLLTGVQMFSGYLDPADDAEAFETDDEGTVWYRTGDRVRPCPAGYLFQGRLDTQVKVGGYRIDLMDVEHAFRGDPDVDESVAFLDPSTQRLCVALQPRTDAGSRTQAQWRQFATGLLPRYMVPSRVFVLPDLPRNNNGKLDRSRTALAALATEPARSPAGADRSRTGGVS